MGWISYLVPCVVVYYIYATYTKFYELVNPLYNLPSDAFTTSKHLVHPIWANNGNISLHCYLSNSKSKYNRSNTPIYENMDLVYVKTQADIETTLEVSKSSASHKIWQEITRNQSSVYLHVLIKSQEKSNIELHGAVKLIKYDVIPKAFKNRYLLHDFEFARWFLPEITSDEISKAAMDSSTIVSYWKPEVVIRLIQDDSVYPYEYVHHLIAKNTFKVGKEIFYKPNIHVDEIGLTSDKYIPLNSTVMSLPLKLTYGSMSLQRWLLMKELEESIASQSSLGFSDKDIDDVRRLVSETSIYMLGITLLASLLHLLFEFLAFQSDIAFWRSNKTLAGLSTRAVVFELVSQIVIFLFLVESGSSLLVSVPAALGIVIQMWKVHRATGVTFRGLALGFNKEHIERGAEEATSSIDAELTRATAEADLISTVHLTALFFPLAIGSILRSLLLDKHLSWYAWFISSLTGCVYAGGFTLMCPQLFINHKLKSVSALPWKYLIYKFLNTFIDDLFAFIIKMPVMHRISVFRDDIVFLVYLYQRWIYRVDDSRPAEK